MDKIEHITNSPIFAGLTSEQIRKVADISIRKSLNKNQVIFAEGEECHSFYLIMSGMVRIFKLAPSGKEQILHVFRESDIFGEVPVFIGGEFPAFATAMTDTELLMFPKDRFVELIRKDPSLSLRIIAELSVKLKQMVNVIENVSLKEVPGRLASHLLNLSGENDDSDTIDLDMTKGNLASLLGTIPETLSRIITRMSDEGIIESVSSRSVKILDRDKLESLAEGETGLI